MSQNNRKYLSICNDNDMTIPYYGGQSAVGLNLFMQRKQLIVLLRTMDI